MGYGAQARRVPAKGAKNLVDVDVFKVGMMAICERGVDKVHTDIFSFSEFAVKCGGYLSGAYGAYIAKAFFDTLDQGVNVEMKVLPFVASNAVQAVDEIDDGTANNAFDIKAALKGEDDKSAFGNKIAWKVAQSFNFEYKLASDSTAAGSTYFDLTSVEHLKVGYLFKVVDTGTPKTEWALITDIDQSTKRVTFAALSNATAYEAATTTFYRADWSLQIAVKNEKGTYEEKEAGKWLGQPMYKGDTEGMSKVVNDAVSGSDYVKLAWDTGNTTVPASVLPAAVTDWTPLTTGSDGTAPTDSDWNTRSATFADEDVMLFLAPESTSVTHNENMAAFATQYINFLYYGQSANGATEATLREFGLSLRQPIRFAMIPSDKWFEMEDPINEGSFKQVPPVGHLAAHWFNTYSESGIGKVAAGNAKPLNTTDRLLDSNGLVHDDSAGKGDRMIRNNSVNILRFRRGKGITVNSARSLSTDKGYVFQNQITGFLLVKKSIKAYLEIIEQDQAGIDAQTVHRNEVFAYLKKKYDENVFYKGQKEDGTPTTMADVVVIVNDFSINTLQDIADGKETIFVQVVFVPPIEEPVLDLASAPVTVIRS